MTIAYNVTQSYCDFSNTHQTLMGFFLGAGVMVVIAIVKILLDKDKKEE